MHGRSRKAITFMSAIANRGVDEKIHEANVVEDWDITRLKKGQAIIGIPEQEPFLFWFKDPKKES